METIWYIVATICTTEYICLLFYVLLKFKHRRSQGIDTTKIQKLFIALVLILVTARVTVRISLFISIQIVYDLLLGIGYLTVFNIYFLISYTWYLLFRFSLYISNSYDLAESYKVLLLKRVSWVLISLDIIAVIAFLILAVFHFNKNSLEVSRFAQPVPELAFSIHALVCLCINYVCIMIIGVMLLKQIKRYYTVKPVILIVSLYVILAAFTFMIIWMTINIIAPNFYSIGLKYDQFRVAFNLLYANLIDVIPIYLFHKQIVSFKPQATIQVNGEKSFLDSLILQSSNTQKYL